MRRDDGQALLYVDRHLVQDGSAPAFEMLRQRGLQPCVAPTLAFATPDHYVPTDSRARSPPIADPEKRAMAQALDDDSRAGRASAFFGLDDGARASCTSSAPSRA